MSEHRINTRELMCDRRDLGKEKISLPWGLWVNNFLFTWLNEG